MELEKLPFKLTWDEYNPAIFESFIKNRNLFGSGFYFQNSVFLHIDIIL